MPEKPAEINNRANDLLRAVRGNMSGIEQARKRVQSVDICFVIDCTGSMQHWIDRVKETVTEILDRIRALYPDTQLRTAFVGYRDFEPKDADQSSYEVVEFMAPEYLRERILSVRASGGDDVAEDMLGGLCRVPGLDWQARARVMLVIADAPPHGRRFHGGKYTDRFADKADPNGRRPEDWEGVVRQIVNKQIDVYFLRCHPCTEMFEKEVRDNIFRRHFPSCRFDVLSLDSDDKAEFLEKIMTATRSSMRSAGF
ncbi:hypothetical protein DFJ74DRAFT_683737 [Hyaloraphidium curvatum]|nr:hypothetical protein DFJ74DRAFT_683737 [Hyaloraphidium curvatum]